MGCHTPSTHIKFIPAHSPRQQFFDLPVALQCMPREPPRQVSRRILGYFHPCGEFSYPNYPTRWAPTQLSEGL